MSWGQFVNYIPWDLLITLVSLEKLLSFFSRKRNLLINRKKKIIQKLFSASLSPYSNHLDEYVEAERAGKEVSECLPYIKNCPKSLFKSSTISSMSFEQQQNSGQNM